MTSEWTMVKVFWFVPYAPLWVTVQHRADGVVMVSPMSFEGISDGIRH